MLLGLLMEMVLLFVEIIISNDDNCERTSFYMVAEWDKIGMVEARNYE